MPLSHLIDVLDLLYYVELRLLVLSLNFADRITEGMGGNISP
jgi:hypothetical protein